MPTLTPYPGLRPRSTAPAASPWRCGWPPRPGCARRLEDLTQQRFIADRIFATGPTATGGAVVYDQVVTSDLFMNRDVQQIASGQEVPILTEEAPVPKVAAVAKWGRCGLHHRRAARP